MIYTHAHLYLQYIFLWYAVTLSSWWLIQTHEHTKATNVVCSILYRLSYVCNDRTIMKNACRLYRNEQFPISLLGYTGFLWTRHLITIYILECPYSISGTVLCAIIKNCLLHPWFSFLWSVIRWRKADVLSVIYDMQ